MIVKLNKGSFRALLLTPDCRRDASPACSTPPAAAPSTGPWASSGSPTGEWLHGDDDGIDGHHNPRSYGMELRDTGDHGFLLPPDQIIGTGEEVWAFHAAVAREIITEFAV